MKSGRLLSLGLVAVFAISCSMISAMPLRYNPTASGDIITGEWDATFHAKGQTAQFTLELKLEGDKVTGKVNSAHTGPGTVKEGSWVDNKLSLSLDFAKHESIAMTGSIKDGMLTGEFRTEGFVDKWEATRKAGKNDGR